MGSMTNSDDDIQRRVEKFDRNLPDDRRNPNAKETFDELTRRAAKPAPPAPGKSDESDDYNGRQTHSRRAEDASD